jgi:uncharacterized membrane protein
MAAVSRLTSVRNAFVTGLLLLAPLAVTWVVFSWLVGQVGGGFRPVFFFFVPERLLAQPGLDVIWNLLATLVVILPRLHLALRLQPLLRPSSRAHH